jgi:hypothetical protein
MRRRVRILVILGMAAETIGRKRSRIIAIHVACRTGSGYVRAGQRKLRLVMVESRSRPPGRGVAQ